MPIVIMFVEGVQRWLQQLKFRPFTDFEQWVIVAKCCMFGFDGNTTMYVCITAWSELRIAATKDGDRIK